MKVLFFGTPGFAARTLDYLMEQGIEVVGVVTRQDKPKGRSGTPTPAAVKKLVLEKYPQLPVFQPRRASDPESASELEKLGADLFVVVAYGQIIKENLLQMPPKGCINVHGSLLPKYRGAAPIQRSIMDGEKETGVTIMHMVKALDAGDMIRKASVSIERMTYGELEEALCELGCRTLVQSIGDIERGIATREPQDESLVTYASKISPEDGLVDFTKPAIEHDRQIRGVTPRPGAWCWVELGGKRKRMKIRRASPLSGSGTPGETLAYGKTQWVVACGEGALSLEEVQLEGKKAMLIADFMRGIQTAPLCRAAL